MGSCSSITPSSLPTSRHSSPALARTADSPAKHGRSDATAIYRHMVDTGRGPLARSSSPKLPSLCVDIRALTWDNAEESKVFLHRKSATMTGYHDGSLRWSGHVARRYDVG